MPQGKLPILTDHTFTRWSQRFNGLDLPSQWKYAIPANAEARRKIRFQCPQHAKHFMVDAKTHIKAYISPKKIVFIVAHERIVVTVFPLLGFGKTGGLTSDTEIGINSKMVV